jgi:hypothetical protein
VRALREVPDADVSIGLKPSRSDCHTIPAKPVVKPILAVTRYFWHLNARRETKVSRNLGTVRRASVSCLVSLTAQVKNAKPFPRKAILFADDKRRPAKTDCVRFSRTVVLVWAEVASADFLHTPSLRNVAPQRTL